MYPNKQFFGNRYKTASSIHTSSHTADVSSASMFHHIKTSETMILYRTLYGEYAGMLTGQKTCIHLPVWVPTNTALVSGCRRPEVGRYGTRADGLEYVPLPWSPQDQYDVGWSCWQDIPGNGFWNKQVFQEKSVRQWKSRVNKWSWCKSVVTEIRKTSSLHEGLIPISVIHSTENRSRRNRQTASPRCCFLNVHTDFEKKPKEIGMN